ncbi:MAG: PilZ domain-containing protein [Bdellovibrionaceae bacterium]|nr:PilZ domain-containing protein [Pseudobdellovibrionaceae bacterium]
MENTNAHIYRRKFPRRRFKRSIGVLSGGKYFMTTGFEIGEGGLSFRSEKVIRMGALVVLNFQVPEGEFISVRAEIRNTEVLADTHPGEVVYGCAFENLVFERKREIRNFVTNRAESEV